MLKRNRFEDVLWTFYINFYFLKLIFRFLVPPQILNDDGGGREIIAKEGETVNVVCNVSGDPAPSVKWYRRPLTDIEGKERESKNIIQNLYCAILLHYFIVDDNGMP